MKLFQQLLVAPAALGLLATGANAAELNINGVSDYAASADQVTSVTQFSDVYPTDWAYQALAGLVETYGCVAGYPNGTFRGNRAMTRYEAAALLNACLDRVTEVTDELRRLMAEFETELAILKGRVDGLEAKVGELEATQFSTTTKLKGKTTFIVGGVDYEGTPPVGGEAVVMQHDTRIGLKTSFTGKDLLFTRLRVANMDGDVFAEKLTKLDTAGPDGNTLELDRLYYKFPVGEEFTFIAGPMARNTESLGMKPTAYKTKVLNFFGGQWGTQNVHNKETGALAGVIWKQKVAKGEPRLTIAANYLTEEEHANRSSDGGDKKEAGILGAAGGNTTVQVGYGTKKWGTALAYRYGQCSSGNGGGYVSSSKTETCGVSDIDSNNFAVNAFWKPDETGFIPAISAGYGWSTIAQAADDIETANWMVGLTWDKVASTDYAFNFGFGVPQYQTNGGKDAPDLSWEASLKMKVANNITVVPAIFYIPEQSQGVDGNEAFGGVVQTIFKF